MSPSPAPPAPAAAALCARMAACTGAARIALERGDAAAARAAAREALALGRCCGADGGLLGEATLYGAMASNLLFDHAAAYEGALEADRLLAPDAHALRARALNLGFVVCAETGDLARALEHSRRATSLAQAGGDRHGMARMLHNRGNLLQRLGDHEQAVRCFEEAVALLHVLVPDGHDLRVARINLADACLDRAAQLAGQAQPALAAQYRQRACEVLPALPAGPAADRPPQLDDLSGLHTWVNVQARLGRLDLARRGLRRCLWAQRCFGRLPRYQANALLALATWHEHAGRRGPAIRCLAAVVARLMDSGSSFHAVQVQERLGRLHAECGEYGQALAWLRMAHAGRTRRRADQAALRWRLATLERQVERRHAAFEEEQGHVRRLAVVARLMSDIHHTLARPIARVDLLLVRCAGWTAPRAQAAALGRVITHVDRATDLARQLRMFSYRAAPQAMLVSLHDSVREAWEGVAMWRRGCTRELAVSGDLRTMVTVDVQRLAVLLRILFIEAGKAAPLALVARIVGSLECGRVELDTVAPQQAAGRDGREAATAGVGLALCRAIAGEMGGRLIEKPGAAASFVLELPLG